MMQKKPWPSPALAVARGTKLFSRWADASHRGCWRCAASLLFLQQPKTWALLTKRVKLWTIHHVSLCLLRWDRETISALKRYLMKLPGEQFQACLGSQLWVRRIHQSSYGEQEMSWTSASEGSPTTQPNCSVPLPLALTTKYPWGRAQTRLLSIGQCPPPFFFNPLPPKHWDKAWVQWPPLLQPGEPRPFIPCWSQGEKGWLPPEQSAGFCWIF